MTPLFLGLLSGGLLLSKFSSKSSSSQSYGIDCSFICNSDLTNLPKLLLGQEIQFKSIITHGHKDPFSVARQIKIGGCFGNLKSLTGKAVFDTNIRIAVNYLILFNRISSQEAFRFLNEDYLEFLENAGLIDNEYSTEILKGISSIPDSKIHSDIQKLFILEPNLKMIPSNVLAFNLVMNLLKEMDFVITGKCFKVTKYSYVIPLEFRNYVERVFGIIQLVKLG